MNRPIGKLDGSTKNSSAAAAATSLSASTSTSTSHIPVPVNSSSRNTPTKTATTTTTTTTTPLGTPSKGASRLQRRSFSGSAPAPSTTAPMSRLKKRSSGFNLKKAWQMAGDDDHVANLLVDSPSPAPRPPSTGIPVFRRETDSSAASNGLNAASNTAAAAAAAATVTATATRTKSLASSKSSITSEEYRSLGDSATTAASSVMKGSQTLDDNGNKENDGEKKLSSKRSIFGMGATKTRPRSGDANAELNNNNNNNVGGSQASAGSGQSPPGSIHSGSSQKDNSPKERLKDWGSKVASKTPLLRRFRSTTTDDRDKDRDNRRKSAGWFSSNSHHDPNTADLPAIEAGSTPQDLLDASPLSRPGSVAEEEEESNKSYHWQVDEDFTAGSLQVSESPMLKFKQAADRYAQPDFTGAGEEEGASPSSARRFPLGRTNTKIEEISQRETDAEAAIPVADPAAPRPKNTKLDDIRQREIDGITARTVANLRLEEMRELNSKARSEAPPVEGKSFRERASSSASSTQYQRPRSRLERTAEENLGSGNTEPVPPAPLPTIDRVASRSSLVPTSAGARKSASGSSLRDKAAMEGIGAVDGGADTMENAFGGQKSPPRRLSWVSVPPAGDIEGANSVGPVAPSGPEHTTTTTSAPSTLGEGIARSTTPPYNPPAFNPQPSNKPNADFFGPSKAQTIEQQPDYNTNDASDQGSAAAAAAAEASLAKSKLPTRATSTYFTSTKNANPNALRRTVSSSYDRAKLSTIVSVPLPPETTTTTISSDIASAPPPGNGEPSRLRSVRSLRSLESIRNRGKHGRKMDDDPTNRIEGERSLFAPGSNTEWELHSDRGSMRSPSPAPILESEDEDEEEAAMTKHQKKPNDTEKFNDAEKSDDDEKPIDIDATPRPPKKTFDPLSMPTPKIIGAYVETPARR
jgi:hypothetical protein